MKTQLKLMFGLVAMLAAVSMSAQNKTVVYECSLDCQDCEVKIMKNIPYEKGVQNVVANYIQQSVLIEFKESKNTIDDLQKALEKLGYTSQYKGEGITFNVNGNCGMCEEKIETAALSVEGVSSAYWDVKTKKVIIALDASQTNVDAIHKAIANAGYDTDKVRADDEVYNTLHSCCKYER